MDQSQEATAVIRHSLLVAAVILGPCGDKGGGGNNTGGNNPAPADRALDVSGYWETPDHNVVQLTQTGQKVTGVYVELTDDWKNDYGFTIGGPALTGTISGSRLTGQMNIRFPKSKAPKSCDKIPTDTTAKFDVGIVSEKVCAGLKGSVQHKTLEADCRVTDGTKDDDLALVYLRGGTETKDCPRFVVKLLGTDLARVGSQCPVAVHTPASLTGDYTPASPGYAPDDTEERRLEDAYRAKLKGLAPASGKYIGNACYRSLVDDADFADQSKYPMCTDQTYLPTLAAEYYYNKKRLTDGVLASLESIAALDKVLGINCDKPESLAPAAGHSSTAALLAGISCAGIPDTGDLRAGCTKLQTTCGNDVDFSPLIDDLYLTVSLREALRVLLLSYPNAPQPWPLEGESRESKQKRVAALKKKQVQLDKMYDALHHTSPWMTDEFNYDFDGFRRQYEEGGGSVDLNEQREVHWRRFVCQALKNRAAATRGPIVERLGQFNTALRCLTDGAASCDEGAFREAVDHSPPIVMIDTGAKDVATTQAAYQLSVVGCRKEMGKAADERSKAYWMAGTGVVLIGLAMLGVPAVANWIGGIIEWAGIGTQAVNAARLVQALAALGFALDVALTVGTFASDIQECANVFYRIGAIGPPTTTVAECPTGAADPGAVISHEFTSCAIASAAKAVVFLLPAAGSLAALKSATDRVRMLQRLAAQRAEEVSLARLGRELPQIIQKFCLAAGTLIRRANGLVPIERLAAGDLVLARDELAGVDEQRRVLGTTRKRAPEVVTLMLANGESLTLTPDHRVYLQTGELEHAGQLRAGMMLATEGGSGIAVSAVRRERRPEGFDVFSIEVESAHTYFAGESGVWVHNDTCSEIELQQIRRLLDNAPKELRQLFADGKITKEQLARLIDDVDDILIQVARRNGEKIPQSVWNNLNGEMDALALPKDVRQAIGERVQLRLVNKETFLGTDIKTLDVVDDIESTTQTMRNQIGGKQYRDPFTNGPANPSGPMEADHILPVAEIEKLDGFGQLSRQEKKEVLYNMSNIQPLPRDLNNSKGAMLAADWQSARIAAGEERLSAAYVQWLTGQQEAARAALQKQIRTLLAGH